MTVLWELARRRMLPFSWLGSFAACGLASCSAPGEMESESDQRAQVVALVTDPGGLGIESATIAWGNQIYLTDESGRALMTMRRSSIDGAVSDRLHLACPAGFAAEAADRVLPWVLLNGTPDPAIRLTCRAQRIRTALVVLVEGPGEVEVYRGDEVLGSTQKGILHAVLESVPEAPLTLSIRPCGGEILEGEPHPVVVAGQSDAYAVLPVTLKNPPQPRRQPRAPKSLRPYRL